MPLGPAQLRRLADEIEAEEAAAARELAEADSDAERKALRDELDDLKAKHEELLARIGSTPPRTDPPPADQPAADPPEPDPAKHYRPGRKRGQVYQDEPNGPGVIWQGDDEPDRVEIDEEGNDV